MINDLNCEYDSTNKGVITKECGEKLVSLNEFGFLCKPYYFLNNYPYSMSECYVREGVLKRLIEAQNSLPNGYRFLILDAYRPLSLQRVLWDECSKKILKVQPDLSNSELENQVSIFVSKPTYDPTDVPTHCTGGAVDLTIVNDKGISLDMGTEFDKV